MRKGSLSWLYTAWLIIISFAINDVKSTNTIAKSMTSATIPASTSLAAIAPATSLAVTTPIPSLAATTPIPSLAATTPIPSLAATTPIPSLAATTPIPSLAATTPIPSLAAITPTTSLAAIAPTTSLSVATPTVSLPVTTPTMSLPVTTPTTSLLPGPNITQINAASSTSINVTWGEVPAEDINGIITRYFVCYKPQTSSNDICSVKKKVDGVNNTRTVLNDLNEFTTYSVAIQAATSEGNGTHGAIKNVMTLEDKPAKGPNITVTVVNSTALRVTWAKLSVNDSNGKIIKYEVCYQRGSTDPKNCTRSKNVTGVNSTTTELTGLKPATMYTVAVRARTNVGAGPLGGNKSETTDESVPESGPNITQINATSSTSIELTWGEVPAEDTNGIITHYFVCYKPRTSSLNYICSVTKRVNATNNRNTVLNDLNEFTNYDVAIQAATSKGNGTHGAIENITTLQREPAKGPNISRIMRSPRKLEVTWNELSVDDSNGVITKYEVCYALGSAVSDCSTRKMVTGVANTTTDITGLTPVTLYTVAVRASTKIGYGPLGERMSVTTNESAPAKGATVTMIIPVSSTALEVTWEKLHENDTNGNITGYRVCYATQQLSPDGCPQYQDVVGADNTTFNLTRLNEATSYFVAVKAGTRAGFGPNENDLNNTTLEDRPSRGPVISIIPESSMSLIVAWDVLNNDDKNGVITGYRVCYKKVSSSGDICNSPVEETMGNVRRITLSNLEKYTNYVVAVKAGTKIGFGPLGANKTNRTNEDIPDAPKIDQPVRELTRISLKWSAPSQANGLLLDYKVCFNLKGGSPMCIKTANQQYEIDNLNPGTTYNISVSASTTVGNGPIDWKLIETTKSALEKLKPVATNMGVSDDKTQIGFTLPSIPSESSGIKYFNVIVKRWGASDDEKIFRGTPQKDLAHFDNSTDGMKAYIAIKDNNYKNGMEIIIGDNSVPKTPARRKRRNADGYRNAPLSEDTQYGIFIRVFYNTKGTSFQSSDILVKKTSASTKGSGTDPVVIVIVVIVVIVFILVAIFGVLLFRRRKPQRNYDGINLETTAKPVVRYPIAIAEFRAHCERLGMNTGLGYQEEYESVRPKGQVSTEIAKRQENVDKNRYNNIHAYDDSRVVLSQLDGEEGSDYINANHIDGFERKNQFIAAQGTLKNTIVDFWRMIWEQKVSSIVMLANPIEKGREKLAVYWPQDRAVKHGPFMIKLDGEVELADYVIRKMTVTQDDIKETRQLTQFHYTVWPDHGVPLYTTSLQAFLTRIRKIVKDDSNPLVVHCSAGVGRTGTFIGIFAMLDMIESTQTVDIFNFVCQMRTQRTHMVQVESQYVFLHKAVLEAIECGDTEINAPDLRVKMIKLNRADPDNPDEIMMGTQFKVLEKYTFVKSNTEEGKKSFNIDKNRNKDILPYEDTRVSLLKSPGVDGSDYINASSVDSYQVRGMYIATQFPLENTVNEFWRMMWEKKSNCIVMLANDDENPDLFKKYWTDKSNDAMLCGNLLVTLDNEEKNEEFVIRNFKLKKNEGGETRDIWHFNFLSWTEDQVPKTTEGIRQMIGKMQDVQRQGGNNPIVIHCSDGSGRTGAFCALVTSLERVKQDQSFNLFQTIMLQRIQRPRMVASVEQYKFCFQAILDFLDSFDQYANFQDLRQ